SSTELRSARFVFGKVRASFRIRPSRSFIPISRAPKVLCSMAPGANYMGGKRNAARARSKDTTGRAQKNHFTRQRRDILS
ncbi:hypothetical protein B0H14DRAFT_2705708, partial [Mycena olivaceomarginata]